jgi:hypothetical protein
MDSKSLCRFTEYLVIADVVTNLPYLTASRYDYVPRRGVCTYVCE